MSRQDQGATGSSANDFNRSTTGSTSASGSGLSGSGSAAGSTGANRGSGMNGGAGGYDDNLQTTTQGTRVETNTGARGTLRRSDERFFQKLSRLGEQEVAISRIASERATDPQVRAFASDLVREHVSTNAEINSVGERKGARFERREASELRRDERKWLDMKADKFDEDYLEAVIDNHEDTLDVLKKGLESRDPDVVAWSNRLMPVINGHLVRARQLEKARE